MPSDSRQERILVATEPQALEVLYGLYGNREEDGYREALPYARQNSYAEIAENIVPDSEGPWRNPIIFFTNRHLLTIGQDNLNQKVREYLSHISKDGDIEPLSIASGLDGGLLATRVLFRFYRKGVPQRAIRDMIAGLYDFLGEKEKPKEKMEPAARIVIPEDAKRKISREERKRHDEEIRRQNQALEDSSEEVPFLNAIDEYVPQTLTELDESKELIYDLKGMDMLTATILPYEKFIEVFQRCMRYITSVERDMYYNVIRGVTEKKDFEGVVNAYIQRVFLDTNILPVEDFPTLQKRLDKALFQLYVIQDLIDDPDITDIKITEPDSIRVRVGGRAYLSNIHFIDEDDYARFIQSIAVKNRIDLSIPTQTFTDDHDEKYVLRFTITAPYITGNGLPIIHIRKVSRMKLMAGDLIEKGMMDEKIRDYLLDCGKHSRGVVFAGPPGSGKTVMLNWFLEEAYESSAEILVIQENDELFAYRKGVMFEHVVLNPNEYEQRCTLEDLGQMALVAGANVFVIGEAKGAEICSAITLSNSGCRTAITIHSPSSTETVDKMADLAMRGYANSYEQAKRMIKSFETIVYLQDFKVQEISQIIGYDEEKKDMIYRPVYRRRDV